MFSIVSSSHHVSRHLRGYYVEDLDALRIRNMDWEAAQLERLRCALMVIAVVLGSAVGGSFVRVQGLDLYRCSSYGPEIGNWGMDLAKVMDETWPGGRRMAERTGGLQKEVESTVDSGKVAVECRSCRWLNHWADV
jgi:hypothetical protein